MDLSSFRFPVGERTVAVDDSNSALISLADKNTYLQNPYKAIVRSDTNEVISIVRDTYKIVRNDEIIDALFDHLVTCGRAFRIDPTHSFVENARMRLQITFPEMKLHDSESDISLSAFVHNSYDMSEGVRFYFGAIRSICSNGMIFGKVLSKYYSKHTKGFSFDQLDSKLEEAESYFPVIQHRIHRLETDRVSPEMIKDVEKHISKRLAESVIVQEEVNRLSQWKLLNRITYYISHDLDQRHRARYQEGVSKVFQL